MVLKVLVLPVVALVGVVVLKEVVNSDTILVLCIRVPVVIPSFLTVYDLQVLKEVVGCAVVSVVFVVLVSEVLDSFCNESG